MKREFSPFYLAGILIVGCVIFRLLSHQFAELIPNVSPLMAVAYVGAMYLPRRWGWLVVPVTLLLTELAFLRINYLTDGSGSMFSASTVLSLLAYVALYAATSGFGIWIAKSRSLSRIIGGSLLCSLLFYVAANTLSWGYDAATGLTPGYAPTLAGWWQANTVGIAGYPPVWLFLRNGVLGDLFFGGLLLLVLDRDLLLGRASIGTPRTA